MARLQGVGVGEAESRKQRVELDILSLSLSSPLLLSTLDRFTIIFRNKHTLREVTYTNTHPETPPTGVQRHTWGSHLQGNRTQTQLAIETWATRPAQAHTGFRGRHRTPWHALVHLAGASGVFRPRIQQASEAFPLRRSYRCHQCRPIPSQSLQRLCLPSCLPFPRALCSLCFHLPVLLRSLPSLPACPLSLMTLTMMMSQRRGQGPQPE